MEYILIDGMLFMSEEENGDIVFDQKALDVIAKNFKDCNFRENEEVVILVPYVDEGGLTKYIMESLLTRGVDCLAKFNIVCASPEDVQIGVDRTLVFAFYLSEQWDIVDSYICYGAQDVEYKTIPKDKIVVLKEFQH